jgi:hypothetical protein
MCVMGFKIPIASWLFQEERRCAGYPLNGGGGTWSRSVGGRGAAPPEFAEGPTGYRLMLKRQREAAAMSDPVRLEAGVQMLAETCPGQSARTLGSAPHRVLDKGFQSWRGQVW